MVCTLCLSSTASCGDDRVPAGETADSGGPGTTAASDPSTSNGMETTSNAVDDTTGAANESSSGGSSSEGTSGMTESSSTGTPSSSYEPDIQPIWDESCVNGAAGGACHIAGGSWATLDLTAGASYNSLLNAGPLETLLPYVEPGAPEGSYLWLEITGAWEGPPANGVCCDQPPPDNGMDPGPLPDDQLDLIEQWIIDGALPWRRRRRRPLCSLLRG